MITLYRMLTKMFFPMFLTALLFFVLILQLVDIFGYIWRYISLNVPLIEIMQVQLYYLPKCISYSLSPSLLFAVSFTLGTLYANNELISVFGAGISLYRLVIPFLLIGALLSVGGFYFEEQVVIETFRQKQNLSEDLLRQRKTLNNTNVTVLDSGNRLVYHADYYNDSVRALRSLILIKRDERGRIVQRIDAEQAIWREDKWEMQRARIYTWNDSGVFTEAYKDRITDPDVAEPPSTFQRIIHNVDEMRIEEAREWIESLEKAGLPYRQQLTDLYRRYSFAMTPFIVALISSAIGGRFKKNILLMSLLLSLVISVLYYVAQMVSSILAKFGFFTPLMGAWVSIFIFLMAALWLFRRART